MDFFLLYRAELSRWVNSSLVDTHFFTIARLEFRPVVTFSHVNIGIVGTPVWTFDVDIDLGLVAVEMGQMWAWDVRKVDVNFVVSSVVWSVYIEVRFGVLTIRSEKSANGSNIGQGYRVNSIEKRRGGLV